MIIEKAGVVMIHLDLKLLTAILGAAEPMDTSIPEGVNHYLAKLLLSPETAGKAVCFGDIDFDAFEESDLPDFEAYCDRISSRNHYVGQVDSAVVRIPPIPLRQRQFC